MTSVIRAFIAIEFPQEVKKRVFQVSSKLQEIMKDDPIRWVPEEKIHLTLRFLGDVSKENIGLIQKIIQAEAMQQKPLDVSYGELGVFPNFHRPRVVWIGVQVPDALMTLQRRIESELNRIGYQPDPREFFPHLTIGRVSRNVSPKAIRQVGQKLNEQKLGFLGVTRADSVTLFRSDLHPDGAVYTQLFNQKFMKIH